LKFQLLFCLKVSMYASYTIAWKTSKSRSFTNCRNNPIWERSTINFYRWRIFVYEIKDRWSLVEWHHLMPTISTGRVSPPMNHRESFQIRRLCDSAKTWGLFSIFLLWPHDYSRGLLLFFLIHLPFVLFFVPFWVTPPQACLFRYYLNFVFLHVCYLFSFSDGTIHLFFGWNCFFFYFTFVSLGFAIFALSSLGFLFDRFQHRFFLFPIMG
jgi:hypothetical protein